MRVMPHFRPTKPTGIFRSSISAPTASAGASARGATGALAPKRAARFVRPDDRPHEFGPAAKPAGPRKSPALYAARFVQFNPFGRNVVLPRRLDLAKERIVQSRAGIAGEPAAAGP